MENQPKNISFTQEDDNESNFSELNNINYKPVVELTQKELLKKGNDEAHQMKKFLLDQERATKRQEKEYIRRQKISPKESKKSGKNEDNDSLIDEKGTEIHGRDKIILLKKVKQYKTLFPDELKGFKLKKNANVKDLTDAILEMEVLVETSDVDTFMMDSIISSIKMIEPLTANYQNYDIRGMADLLKSNKQFNTLSKQLFIKYNVFSQVPLEIQMVMVIMTTGWLCTNKNKAKNQINSYLDETI